MLAYLLTLFAEEPREFKKVDKSFLREYNMASYQKELGPRWGPRKNEMLRVIRKPYKTLERPHESGKPLMASRLARFFTAFYLDGKPKTGFIWKPYKQ